MTLDNASRIHPTLRLATPALREAVSNIIVDQMADVLIDREIDLSDRETAVAALYDEGFRSPSLEHCGDAALAEAARRRA